MDAPGDLYIPRILQEKGLHNYEPETLAVALTLSSTCDGLFVDVGANVGVFSLVVAGVLGKPVKAFEPLPNAAKVLKETAERHELPIDVSRVALSDKDGEAEFYVSSQTDTSSGLNQSFRPSNESFKVSLGRLDDVLKEERIGFLKIDTETTEPAVLAGAAETIDKQRPPMIIEVLKNRTEEGVQDFFAERGYSWYHITSADRWNAAERVEGDSTYQHNNWLFTPEPLDDSFFNSLKHWKDLLAQQATQKSPSPSVHQATVKEASSQELRSELLSRAKRAVLRWSKAYVRKED